MTIAVHGPTPFMQRLRGRLFTDVVQISDGSTPPVLDTNTGQVVEGGEIVYQGPALIRLDTDSRTSTDPTLRSVEQWNVRLPHSVNSVNEDDLVTVLACDDPLLVGAVMTVRSVHLEPWRTVRQIVCEEKSFVFPAGVALLPAVGGAFSDDFSDDFDI